MSDFDAVLERVFNEPSFAAALAADPDAALSGYRLDAGEVELLRSQASSDSDGGLAAVETRTNKSSTVGLFSAFADLGHTLSAGSTTAGGAARHVADQVGTHGSRQGLGDAPGAGGSGGGSAHEQWPPAARTGVGSAHEQWPPAARSGFGAAPQHDGAEAGGPPAVAQGLGEAPGSGFGDAPAKSALADAVRNAEHLAPPEGYHPHIDANGDGHWDKATFIGTKGHGVEILVDVNHDGHADFVGHDTDGDGLVDSADYDKDDNGVFEKRMYDDNGDGWLDRTVWRKNG